MIYVPIVMIFLFWFVVFMTRKRTKLIYKRWLIF